MADFKPAYAIVKRWEGGYVNNPNDKGGETYAGIARKFWPNWSGWEIVDNRKPLKTNAILNELTFPVENFYFQLWQEGNFGKIVSQDVANILFDFRVNSGGTGIKKVQQILGVIPDGKLGTDTLRAINASNSALLNNQIKEVREQFYNTLAANPTQEIFLKGWLNRLNAFPTLPVVSTVAVVVIIGIVLLMLNK